MFYAVRTVEVAFADANIISLLDLLAAQVPALTIPPGTVRIGVNNAGADILQYAFAPSGAPVATAMHTIAASDSGEKFMDGNPSDLYLKVAAAKSVTLSFYIGSAGN
jgi:hypothetical protein